MKKFVWISKHSLTDAQLDDLRRVLGDDHIEVIPIYRDIHFDDPDSLIKFNETIRDADMIGVVMPLDVVETLLQHTRGIPVVRSILELKVTDKLTTSKSGVRYHEKLWIHKNWQQILSIKIETNIL